MSGLSIRKDPCELDFLSLGALVHRLDPGVIPFRKARSLEIHVSGGEYNVAASLADCFGLKTGIATAMVNYPIGELVQSRVREMGVTPFYKWFEHDGVRGPNIATVYSDRGYGVRPPVVFYNRSNEAGALLKPGDFDWAGIFGRGVRWFHSGGIFASLSETTAPLIIEGMQAAKAAGAITSFDLNYRAKLWASVGGAEHGQQVIKRIASHLDALIGNEEDLQKGLGIPGPEVAGKSKLDPDTFFTLIDRVVEQSSQHQARRDHPARGAFDQPPRLGRRALARRQAIRQPDAASSTSSTASAAATASPPGLIYGLLVGPIARRRAPPRLGPRRPADHVPRRRHHGQARRGRGTRQGRLGTRSAMSAGSPVPHAHDHDALPHDTPDARRRRCTMLTAQGSRTRRERLWRALPVGMRPADRRRSFASDLPRRVRSLSVRLPDGRVGRAAAPRARPRDAGRRRHARPVSRSGLRRRGRSLRAGTTETTRPRIAAGSSSSRRSNRLAGNVRASASASSSRASPPE